MRGRGRRFGAGAACALALGAAVAALGGCGGSGGGGGFFVATSPFSAQLLPLQIDGDPTGVSTASGAGDVAFAKGGDALVVGGDTDTVLRVSRTSGAVTVFAADVTGGMGSPVLVSIAVHPTTGAVYVGAEDGEVRVVDDEGGNTLLDDTGDGAVNGLAFAPRGFGEIGGQLVVASESDGLLALVADPEAPTRTVIAPPPTDPMVSAWSDVAFLDGVLYALDRDNALVARIAEDEEGALQSPETFVDTADWDAVAPDGLAADAVSRQLLVADPATGTGDGTLLAVTVPEPPEGEEEPDEPVVSELARYAFDPALPNGLAFDGVRNLLFVTHALAGAGMTLRGVVLPAFANVFPLGVPSTDEDFGDLTFDLEGRLVGTGNLLGQPDVDDGANRVYRVRRDGVVTALRTDVGDAVEGEWLLAIALDPATGTLYVGTDRGRIFALNDGGTSLFATLPDPESITDLALGPPNADGLAGMLVAVTSQVPEQGESEVGGKVYGIDPAAPDPATVLFDYDMNDVTGAVFASDGTLYLLDQDGGAIDTLTVVGAVISHEEFASGLDLPKGMALDEGGGRLLVAQQGSDPGADAVLEVPLDTAMPAEISDEFAFLGGFVPAGVAFDGLGSLFVVTDTPSVLTVDRVAVFPPPEE